jgi:hypothetical protein
MNTRLEIVEVKVDMVPNKPLRAFISYSRADQQFAIRLTSELKTAGYSVWMDQFDIPTGARWDDEIEKALRESQIFLFIMTPASISSDNAKDEVGYAIDHDKYILPVLLEPCEVPFRLRRMQYVDFTRMSFDEGIKRAKELLSRLVQEIEETSIASATDGGRSAQFEPATIPTRRGAIPNPLPAKSGKQTKSYAKGAMAGVGFLAIGTLAIAVLIFRSFLFPPASLPTLTRTQNPTDNQIATTVPSSTNLPATPTSEIPAAFKVDFNTDGQWNHDWTLQMRHENPRKKESFSSGIKDGQLVLDLAYEYIWAYYLYNRNADLNNVSLDIVVNDMQSVDTLGLICNYGAQGWYEFDVNGGGEYFVRYVDNMNSDKDEARFLIKSGAIPDFIFSTEGPRENDIQINCKGNKLSLTVNDDVLLKDYPSSKYILDQGQVGIAARSYIHYPVQFSVDSISVREE